jgi:dipeptidyl aminopeptidase/acylaminoacyl peptidase
MEVAHGRYDVIEPTALAAGDVLRFDPHTHSLAGVRFAAARRSTHWFDAGMKELQAELNKKLAPQRCELREWNADRTRFLAEIATPDDPGGFMFVDAAAGKMLRCGDRASWLTTEQRNPTHEFDFDVKEGRRYAGYLTMPRKPRLNPPPVLVYFHDGPWFSDAPVFNRGAQALAALGFAVLQLNHRGSTGYGTKHLNAIKGGLDRAALEDVQAVLARLSASKLAINTKMVAALGNGVGGYLAVRMTQLAPETFRCAVAINAPGDLDAWRSNVETAPTLLSELRKSFFGADREALRAQSAITAAATTKAPVLVVHGTGNTYVPISLGRQLYHAAKKGSEETAFLELAGAGHGGWSEETTAKLFAELGRFFNATIYNYGVKVQKPQVVK